MSEIQQDITETISDNITEASLELSEHHASMIAASGISQKAATERGYRTVTTKIGLKRLGFSEVQCIVPTLLIPNWGVNGEIVLYHHRPDTPRIRDGKAAKYEFPGGSRMAIDVHPSIRESVRRPDLPLIITEGVKKADAAISAGLCCIAVLGTWNWRGTNEWGGKTALPDWDSIALKDRENRPRQVYIAFDSDVMLKESVQLALTRLSSFLKSRGAQVAYIYLPPGDDAGKMGLDDYLAAGRTTEELLALATPHLRPLPQDLDDEAVTPYRETPHGLVLCRQTQYGRDETPLSNFTARIVADIIKDDGAESVRMFEIVAERNRKQYHISIPAQSFSMMNWPIENLGAGAILYPGMGTKDHTRAAIQMMSGDPPLKQVYAHTGWRRIGEENEGVGWAYLHAGGAIGTEEPMQVTLPAPLERFVLPSPPTDSDLAKALRASMSLWKLAPHPVSIALHCAIYRSVLGTCDFGLFLAGPTGVFKSELAAIAQQHFGAGLDARHLPGSWTSTDNALEGLAFAAKDALLVVDDFAPSGSSMDVQRLHAKADRLLRGQGNGAGRGRMRADGSLKPSKYPRGLILSTGEDVPQGHSLRARTFVLEIAPGMVSKDYLTKCQKQAADGIYAVALAGFIAYLAPRHAEVQSGLHDLTIKLRDSLAAGNQHLRTPGIAASLGAGLHWFLECARDVGAIDETQLDGVWNTGWKALQQAAKMQDNHQLSSEPAHRFVELLSAALTAGKAHLTGPTGDIPTNPEAWGWSIAGADYQAKGDHIGWVDGNNVYLQRDAAYAAAKRMGAESGDGIVLTANVLSKRLKERGLLASTGGDRGTTVRHVLSSGRREVLHLHASQLNGTSLGDDSTLGEPE